MLRLSNHLRFLQSRRFESDDFMKSEAVKGSWCLRLWFSKEWMHVGGGVPRPGALIDANCEMRLKPWPRPARTLKRVGSHNNKTRPTEHSTTQLYTPCAFLRCITPMATTAPPKASHVAATIICNSIAAIAYTLVSKATLRTIKLPLTALFVQAIVSSLALIAFSHYNSATKIELFKPWKVRQGRVARFHPS